MTHLKEVLHLLATEHVPQEHSAHSRMFKISNPYGLNSHGVTSTLHGSTVHAVYVYDSNQNYEVAYIELDMDGTIRHALAETEGVLPSLFLSPDGVPFVCIQDPMKTGSDIVLPVLDRSGVDQPKPIRNMVGEYVGNVGESSVFHNRDIFNPKKEDKLEILKFADGTFKKRETVKIPLPQCEHVVIDEDHERMYAFSYADGNLLIRKMDIDGNIGQQSTVHLDCDLFSVVSVSQGPWVQLIAVTDNCLSRVTIEPAGKVQSAPLAELESPLYSLWAPKRLGEERYVFRFTHEYGNGWATLDKGKLKSCFVNSGNNVYSDSISGESIVCEKESPILSGMAALDADSYCVELYTQPSNRTKPTDLFILQKKF
ncbi:hypothetical protein [Fontibacillus sp. BL9]|uniref:hypothetical protein n=1 Tax=Fontibacillus sp. BL9 TaxID=3389971 RepID=UPI00397BB4C2